MGRFLLIVGLILAVVAVLMVLFVEGDSSTYWAAAIGVPGVTLKDYPAKALAEVAAPDFDLGAVVSGGVPASRALSWALVAYLATGRDGGPVPGFDAFRRRMDRGGRAEPLFERHFGRPGALATRLRTWLEANQNPDGSWGSALRMTVTSTAARSDASMTPSARARGSMHAPSV